MCGSMSKHHTRNLPVMMTELAMASWETIYHRTLLMAQGTCAISEYQRMFVEKAEAMQASTMALMTGRGNAAALAPYLVRSRANARRLRRGG
jgi:Na+/glutamate symporter